MQIEQVLYHILLGTVSNPICKGAVLNVGLGLGGSARVLLTSRRVQRVVSLEKNQAVIDAYRLKYPANDPLESRHTIVLGDVATVTPAEINPPFDWVYIDIVEAFQESIFDGIKTVMTKLKLPGALTVDGGVTIELYANHILVRRFREWLEDNGWTTEVVRPALSEMGRGRAGAMLVFRP